ncbi:retrovirus-related pol polyprotein from transposon TNT 1-94 [Tanacetum coccineum]
MTGTKFDIKKFDETGDFGLWRIKMRALLIQHGCEAALEVLPVDMEAQTKAKLNKKAHSVVILCLVAGELNASIEEKDNLAQVWHKRLGHISESHRVSFGVGMHTTQGVIEYVHSDLWGPSQVESLGGKRYFLSIVDDYSRMVWVYILRFKHEAFGKFKEWKQLVENQTGKTVKKLRTDKGLKFCNQEFEQLCDKSGIARHLTVARTSQQNGSPSTMIEKETPMEMWSGHLSDYEMLRIFDCVVISHIKQGKLELREVKCVLLGYPEGVKGYRLYRLDDESPKIVEVELQRLNNHMLEEDQTDQEDGDDEDAGDQETDQTLDLTDYQLVRDRKPRTRTKPLMWLLTHYELEQLDVKMTVLHRNLEEVIYMRQPPGYEQGNKVCLLKKSLYGLKQSPRQWSYAPGEYIYLLLYVEDMLIACKSKAEIGSTKSLLKKEFDIKELEEAKNILGMESHNPVKDYDVERMSKVPYANVVGSLMYLIVCTRLDITYAVSVVSRYLANPSKDHWEALKWILTYLSGTTNVGLVYGTDRCNHVEVIGFVNLDYTKDSDKVALSTTEAEYMALTEAIKEAIWLWGLLEELGVELNTVAVNCDNQGVIHLSRNYVFHERTKHINVHYHFIKEVLEEKTVKVLKVGTEHNAADALTKVVPGLKLQHCLELLNVGIG